MDVEGFNLLSIFLFFFKFLLIFWFVFFFGFLLVLVIIVEGDECVVGFFFDYEGFGLSSVLSNF